MLPAIAPRSRPTRSTGRPAFSLLELLLALVLVGTLAALVLAKFAAAKERAYVAALKSDLRTFATQAELYADKHPGYPPSVAALADGGTWRWSPGVAPVAYRTAGESLELLLGHAKTTTLCALRLGTAANAGQIICVPDLTLDFVASTTTPAAGDPVQFDATTAIQQLAFGPARIDAAGLARLYAVDPSEIATVAWDFGDGSAAAGPPAQYTTVEHRYARAGTYTVRLALLRVAGPLVQGSKTLDVGGGGDSAGGGGDSGGGGGAAGVDSIGGAGTGGTTPRPPVPVIAASPLAPATGEPVALSAAASTDPDGTIVQYQWMFADGSTRDGAAVTHAFAAAGETLVRLTVTDDQGLSASATQVITVGPNLPPVVVARFSPARPTVGAPVQFSATGSSDPEGRALTFAWDFADFALGTGETTAHTFGAPGTWPVTLRVMDAWGAARTDTLQVPVNGRPTARFTSAPATAVVGRPLNLDPAASTDPEGEALAAHWTLPGGASLDGALGVQTWTPAVAGRAAITLTVTDPWGAAGTVTDTLDVNAPPVAGFTVAPTAPTTGEPTTFDARTASSDPDGVIASYAWTVDGVAAGTASTLQRTFTTAGAHTIALTVTDDRGTTTSATQGITLAQPALLAASISVGSQHACALNAAGKAYCWGFNGQGRLGDGTITTRTVPTPVNTTLSFAQIAAAGDYTCALTGGGQAYCWGNNTDGQFGNGTSWTTSQTPVAVSGGLTFSRLAVGGTHVCGLLRATGAAYCWGNNHLYQLGDGSGSQKLTPTAVAGGRAYSAITAGQSSTCAIATSGTMYCWGDAASDAIGPVTRASCSNTTGGSSYSGRPCAKTPQPFSDGRTYSQVAAGNSAACALTTTGATYCWGNYANGAVGNGLTSGSTATPYAVPVGGAASDLSMALGQAACVRTEAGLVCWGYDATGAMGLGSTAAVRTPILAWPGQAPVAFGIASNTACGIAADGSTYCAGRNNNGQLGNGTTVDASVPSPVTRVP